MVASKLYFSSCLPTEEQLEDDFDLALEMCDVLRLAAGEGTMNGESGGHVDIWGVVDQDSLSETTPQAPAGQGMSSDPAENRAVEHRAMEIAKSDFEGKGYAVTDVHTKKGYHCDLRVIGNGEELSVEVKGTRARSCSKVIVSREEYYQARNHRGEACLFVVYAIDLDRTSGVPVGTGGEHFEIRNWAPEDEDCMAVLSFCCPIERHVALVKK